MLGKCVPHYATKFADFEVSVCTARLLHAIDLAASVFPTARTSAASRAGMVGS